MKANPHQRSSRPEVDVSFVEPELAGWGHCVLRATSLPTSVMMDQPAGNIYLGPQQCAGASSATLSDLSKTDPPIRAIVNCTNAYPNHHESNGILYCRVPINDETGANILVYLEGTSDFIHHHVLKGHSVLVHCQMGISRSATVVIAYLMKHHDMSRDTAYRYVKERRPKIDPNPGFWDQLEVYEKRLGKKKESASHHAATFDRECVEQSMARYQTIRDIVDDMKELFPEIDSTIDAQGVLSTSLDYIFGRGVLDADLRWFGALCDVMKGSNPCTIVDSMLEDGSEFRDNWSGDVSSQDIDRVKAIIGSCSSV
jgi:protein-tyrosine phosphatase